MVKKKLKSKKVIKSKKVKNNNPRGIEKKYKKELEKIVEDFNDFIMNKLSDFSVRYDDDYGEKHISVENASNSDDVNLITPLVNIYDKLTTILEKDI